MQGLEVGKAYLGRLSIFLLTLRAKIGAPVANSNAFNRGGTNLTGLATPMCCIEVVLLAPLLSAGTSVVAVVCHKQVDADSVI